MLKTLLRARGTKAAANRLYAAVASQARDPLFFERLAAPDTMDGRFDLVCLHAWLVMDRLTSNRALAQAFVNAVFTGFDEALRQSGTGDIGMNRRLKTLAGAFYGRLEAYRAASTLEELADAIQRNLFRGAANRAAQARALATYASKSRSCLTEAEIATGNIVFASVPTI
jgi:cytochrome b pre-mRNA-processing protein 3